MPTRKRLILFCVVVVGGYVALVLPKPWIGETYARFFRGGADREQFRGWTNLVFGVFSSDEVRLEFYPPKAPSKKFDADMLIIRPAKGKAGRDHLSCWHRAYVPTITIILLVLATPIAWKRRWIALGFGLILVHAFIIFGLSVSFIKGLTDGGEIGMFTPAPFVKSAIDLTAKIVAEAPVTSFLFPAIIWILVTFRRTDLTDILDSPPADGESSST